jgi:glutamyl/glutaminyl-tRNA synthetase
MIDYSEIYDRFEAIKRTLIHLENRMLNDGTKISATDHSVILKLLRMAETEAQGLLVLILRMRGSNGTVRRHGQEAALSWSAGIDHTSGQIAMMTTDVFSNVTDTYLMAPDQFERLVEYFNSIRQQMRTHEDVADDSCKPR